MPVSVICSCGKKLVAKDSAAGKSARCANCNQQVRFPALDTENLCPFCPAKNPSSSSKCVGCGALLDQITYVYRMKQLSRGISVFDQGDEKGDEAAKYLEGVVNEWAKNGWEFYRIDEFTVTKLPGCLFALLGSRAIHSTYYVATFRKLYKRPLLPP